ncbi:hypothetical protein ONZ45_g11352 [Pleurotus djamor]|nr:hypothetical protein ONZ45_g11352 [Pleurotus djamor]
MKWTLLSALAWSPLVLSKPANDWSKPCFNGECAYDLPQSSGNLGTLHLTGAAITDITPASGWVILDCDPHALEQEIRLVCSSHDLESAGCRHVFDNSGPVDKVVRLPESVITFLFNLSPLAHPKESVVQVLFYELRGKVVKRDGLTPTVHVFRVDSKWSQVDVQKTGPVNFTFTASNFPDANQIEARGTQFEWPSWMTDTVGTVASTVSNIVDHAQSASDAIHSTVENVKTAMGDAFHSAVDGAKTIITGAPSAVVNAKAAVSDGIDEACKHATDQSIAGIDDIKAEFNKFQADMEKMNVIKNLNFSSVRKPSFVMDSPKHELMSIALGALKDKLINFAEHTWDTIKPLIDDISREHARLRGINQHIEDQLNQDLRALEEKLLSFFMSKVAPQAHLVSDAALSVYNDIKIMAEKVRHDLDTLREVNKLYNDHLEEILKNCGQKLMSLGNTAMHYIQPALDNAKATLTDAFHQLNEIREMHKQHNEMIMKAMIDSARPTFDALLSAYNDVKTMLANKVQDFREANTIHYPQSNISKEVHFNQTEDTVIVSFRGPNFIPCKDNLFQPSLIVLARGQMDATANIEVNTTGSLIPPMVRFHR